MSRLPKIRVETFAAIAATIVSTAALFVAWDQARIARTEVKAAIWPAMQINGFTETGDGIAVGVRARNAGVGPALVERVHVTYDGVPVATRQELAAHWPGPFMMSYDTLAGRVVAPGESFDFLRLQYPETGAPADLAEIVAAESLKWKVEACYCSTLNECWISNTDVGRPQETDSCDGVPEGDF